MLYLSTSLISCIERETRDKDSFDFVILKSGNFVSLEQTYDLRWRKTIPKHSHEAVFSSGRTSEDA
jgi:hypothetical protein